LGETDKETNSIGVEKFGSPLPKFLLFPKTSFLPNPVSREREGGWGERGGGKREREREREKRDKRKMIQK